MPWGDYGNILVSGMSAHLGRKDGLIQLERTGPFVPPITFPGIGDIVVTEQFRYLLEASGLTGFTFGPLIKTHVVKLDWQSWNQAANEPQTYPESGEPEDYILGKPHDPRVAEALGPLFELVPNIGGIIDRTAGIRLKVTGTYDIFRAEGALYNYVTTRAKDWFAKNASPWVAFRDVVLA